MENFGNHSCNSYFGMTDEQIETLRKQIAVYSYISELLIQSYINSSSHQHLTGGAGMEKICDARLINKLNSKQRWSPTAAHIQALERIYATNLRAPNKERVKKITSDLSKLGPISESNVYNWFQNKRARSKKKENSNVDAKSKGKINIDYKDVKTEQNEFVASLPSKVETMIDYKDKKTESNEFVASMLDENLGL